MILIDIARKPITFIQCDRRIENFAPSWDLLNSYREGFIEWDSYIVGYLDEMQMNYVENPNIFHEIAETLDDIKFICWCNRRKSIKRCHRFLLRRFLERLTHERI